MAEGPEDGAEELERRDGEFDEAHHLPPGAGIAGPGIVTGEDSNIAAIPWNMVDSIVVHFNAVVSISMAVPA
jgi:hypothetical protein